MSPMENNGTNSSLSTTTLRRWLERFSASARRASSTDPVALTVVRVTGETEAEADGGIIGRLSDVGIAPGETIHYFGRSPLGEPLYISVRDTVLALRFEEAELIEVVENGSQGSV